jgi:hypothetical protein
MGLSTPRRACVSCLRADYTLAVKALTSKRLFVSVAVLVYTII